MPHSKTDRVQPASAPKSSTALLFGAFFLLLVTPLVVFLKHHRYGLFRAEVMVAYLALAVVAAILMLISQRWRWARPVFLGGAIALFADIQFDAVSDGPWLTIIFLVATVVMFVLRGREGQLLVPVLATVLAVSALQSSPTATPRPLPASTARPDLPVIVHLILDEHIGIEGMSAGRMDTVAGELRASLESRGFLLFGGAYSQHVNSNYSISHLLNYEHGRYRDELVGPGSAGFRWQLQSNPYLEQAAHSGYRLRVYQPEYMNLCTPALLDRAQCYTYRSTSAEVLQHTPLSAVDRLALLFGLYRERASMWYEFVSFYGRAKLKLGAAGVWLPRLTSDRVRVSPLATESALVRLRGDLAAAQPGDVYFAHLLLPHYPYVFDAGCQLRPRHEWLYREDLDAPNGQVNTAEGRLRRYSAYAEQVRCVQRRVADLVAAVPAPLQGQTVVIVQGDHGSRLSERDPLPSTAKRLMPTDYVDSYSTLFAVKLPSTSAGYDPRPAAIPCLLQSVVDGEFREVRGLDRCHGPAKVFLRSGNGPTLEQPLPPLERTKAPGPD